MMHVGGPAEGEITRQLQAWTSGDERGGATVFTALHATLRRIASRALAGERVDHTLETSGLISEAFFRLLDQQHVAWQSRAHFLAIAAQMMRRVLVDHARGRAAVKRGHCHARVPLDGVMRDGVARDESLAAPAFDATVIALHHALERLSALDPAQSELVELRVFGGLTQDELAVHFGVSLATIERRWRLARAWLVRELDA